MNHITKLQENLLTAVQTSPYHEKTIVFGEGAEAPLLMMIGEAPGGDEEKQGRPFVGKAGKNLSAFLEVVGLKREEIYISNVVKLRPTKESPKTGKAVNRPPSAEEIAFSCPFCRRKSKRLRRRCLLHWEMSPSRRSQGRKKPSSGTIMADLSRWRTEGRCLHFITLRQSFITAPYRRCMMRICWS